MSNKFLKVGILSSVLVVPALFFLFLKYFGENTFDLPYFFPELNEAGHVQVIEGDTVFHRIPDFSLVNQLGDSISLNQFDEDLKVVSYFFSRCGTVCPILNENLSRLQRNLKNETNVELLSITVDPEYDTPEVLKAYASSLVLADSKNWNFLSGDKAYIYNLAIKGMKLPVSDASVYDSTIVDIDEAFIHSDKVLLLDQKNYVRGIYEGTDLDELDRLQLEIKVLLDGLK